MGDFICANMHARLAIIYQSVVATGQLQLQLLSANIVNDVDTKRLGTVPTAAGMIARLAYARVRSAGIELAQQLLDLRELGMLFYVAASSETLGDALQRMARYSSTVNEGLSLKCLAGEEIRFVYQYVGVVRYLDRHQIEFFMTLLIRLCRHLTGLRLAPSRARIMHRRSSPAGSELAAYFGGKITFGERRRADFCWERQGHQGH